MSTTTTTTTDQQARNKELVTTVIDLMFTQGDPEAAGALLADDFVDHDPTMGQVGTRAGFQDVARVMRRSFPDWHSDVELLIAEGDLVTEVFTASGTFTGAPLFGQDATGRPAQLKGINVFRVRDGQLVERWGRVDDLGFRAHLSGA
jgi:steroid delta-isomerase-like uncharacterized protein